MSAISIDWGLLLAGLGLFMLGMYFLELSLKSLLNQAAVRVMRGATASLWLAIPLGVALTALMQSSSLVGLLVLAFVGAGVMPMRHALGVILGANLGTTLTGWLVTWLGFHLELDHYALPLMGLGALLKVWCEGRPRLLSSGHLILGLGLLLFGLDAMKTGVEDIGRQADLSFLVGWSPIWFLGLGVALAAVIQSSSAVVMLVLSAMYAGLIDFQAGAAMVIGADVGTTSTMLLASTTGAPVKKQVAVFHLIYNLFTAVAAFALLLPLAPRVMAYAGIDAPLLQLVLFHSSFNFFGIFLALPFLSRMANWLEQRVGREDVLTQYLHKVPTSVPSAALLACQQEGRHLQARALGLIAQAVGQHRRFTLDNGEVLAPLHSGYGVFIDQYALLKQLESSLVRYASAIAGLNAESRAELEAVLARVRSAAYAVKSLKDVRSDLQQLWESDSAGAIELRKSLAKQLQHLLELAERWLQEGVSSGAVQEEERSHRQYLKSVQGGLYHQPPVEGLGLSSLLNIVREVDECGRELLRMMSPATPLAEAVAPV